MRRNSLRKGLSGIVFGLGSLLGNGCAEIQVQTNGNDNSNAPIEICAADFLDWEKIAEFTIHSEYGSTPNGYISDVTRADDKSPLNPDFDLELRCEVTDAYNKECDVMLKSIGNKKGNYDLEVDAIGPIGGTVHAILNQNHFAMKYDTAGDCAVGYDDNGNANHNGNGNSNSNTNDNSNSNDNSNDNDNMNGNDNYNDNANSNDNSNGNSNENENDNSNGNVNSNTNDNADNYIVCANNADCNDSVANTEDVCHFPGESQSYCTNDTIICRFDADCSPSGPVGFPYCENNAITQDIETYTCTSPGTSSSTCVLVQTKQTQPCGLEQICQNVTCVDQETPIEDLLEQVRVYIIDDQGNYINNVTEQTFGAVLQEPKELEDRIGGPFNYGAEELGYVGEDDNCTVSYSGLTRIESGNVVNYFMDITTNGCAPPAIGLVEADYNLSLNGDDTNLILFSNSATIDFN